MVARAIVPKARIEEVSMTLARSFTVDITVGAGGVVSSTDLTHAFFYDGTFRYVTSDAYFSFSAPTVSGGVVLSETTTHFTYAYGHIQAIFAGDGSYLYDESVDEGTGSADRTNSISIGGNSDALRALAAGQTLDVAVSYSYDAAYFDQGNYF